MAVNSVRIQHGATARIGTGAASATRLTGANPGTAISNPLTVTFGGQSANIATAEELNASFVRKAKGIRDAGTATLTFLKDDNDAGQVAALAAFNSANQFPFAICDGTSGAILIAFEGLVSGFNHYAAGGSGDWIMLELTIDLTAQPGG